MTWKNLFENKILTRGRSYYRDGNVLHLGQEDESTWNALVLGSTLYGVTLELDPRRSLVSAFCSCPYAEGGNYCKHMAAACFALESKLGPDDGSGKEDPDSGKKKGSPKKEPDLPVENPFGKLARSGEYHYFDLNYITRILSFPSSVCRAGREIADSGKLEVEECRCGYLSDDSEEAPVIMASSVAREDADPRGYRTEVWLDRDNVLRLFCTCELFNGRMSSTVFLGRKVCRHGMALLYTLEDYILRENPGDATDRGTMHLMQVFGKQKIAAAAPRGGEKRRTLRLEPRLEDYGRAIAVGFRAGTDKLYVLKNLTEFVDEFEKGSKATFGKSTVIDYSECSLDELSARYFRFIKDAVEEERCRDRYWGYDLNDKLDYDGIMIKGSVPLVGRHMDAFYDLVRDIKIDYMGKGIMSGRKGTLSCRDGKPDVQITVEKATDPRERFEGVRVSGRIPVFTEGVDYCYWVSKDDCLERIPKEQMGDIMTLCQQADDDGNLRFTVGRGFLPWFYHTMLPVLKQTCTVTETDAGEIAEYVPPEPEFKFYLDATDHNALCQVIAVYGETDVNVTDLLSQEKASSFPKWRDILEEREGLDRVLAYFPEFDEETGILHCGQDEDAVFRVLSSGVSALMEMGEVNCTDKFLRLRIRPVPKFTVGVSMGGGLLDLDISSGDLSREELLAIMDGYRQKKKYIRLRNGDFLRTDDEEDRVEALANMMDALRITPKEFVKGKMQFPAYRALYLDRMLEENSDIYAKRDSHFRQLVKEFKTVSDSDFEVPESLAPVLRGYQEDGFKWLRTLEAYHFGGILADDMGLGKTLQMIAVFLAWKEEGKPGPSLVVCPASLVYNWGEEIERFAPQLQVALIAGTQKEREEMLADYGQYDVLVTSYDLLKRDIDQYEDITFLGQVLDEAQFIKNHTTAAAKSVKLIKSQYRYALTGTPIENRLSELWSIFDYLMPGFLYGYDVFRKEIEVPVVRKDDKDASGRLRRMVSPFILRRLKKDVLKDLPDKLEKVVYAKAEKEQQRLCDGQVARIQEMLASQDEEEFSQGKIKTLAELTKLREICCDPSLLYENYDGGSAKREACLELISQAMEGGHRMLIFSQFTSMLALLEEDLDREGIAYYKIIGATPKQERVELVRAFNEGETPVFLISLKAGGTGLNLIGADVVIHYDPWWNMAVENQATDRAHRIGQTRVVTEYKIILKDSVEERILKMQEAKSDLADEILSGEESGGLGSLSREDLLELLGV